MSKKVSGTIPTRLGAVIGKFCGELYKVAKVFAQECLTIEKTVLLVRQTEPAEF